MKIKLPGLKLLAVNYAVFLTLLVTVELIGQIGYRVFKGRFLFEMPSQLVFKEHPFLSGIAKENFHAVGKSGSTITTGKRGFRITRKNDYQQNAINVVCLGGSTTFGTLTTDEDSWPYKLQTKLGSVYNVYNMGVPGYTTLEALIQLLTFVPELDPDVIIVYEGWNDIRNYHVEPKSPDYYWHGMTQKTNLEFGNRTLWDNFFITKLAMRMGRILNPPSSNLIDAKTFTRNDPYVDSLYVRNLKTIKLLCDRLNAKTIFIPQVLNVDLLSKTGGTYSWTPHIENKQMPVMMQAFNVLMEKAIREDGNTIVIDNIQQKYKWTPAHFADFGHFNKAGGDLFTDILKKALEELKLQHPSHSSAEK